MPRPNHRSTFVRPTLRRCLFWVAATLVALEIVYVVAGNLFLAFGLRPIASGRPEKLFMGYERAYTLWPGVAHVTHFRLRNQSASIQWKLDVEEADVTIDLVALFRKEFHATRTRASGVAFRLRRKLDDVQAAEPRARVLVPIDGYSDPPLKPVGPPEADVSDADYDEWRVDMQDVEAEVREVWVDEWRCLGTARVIGGFFVKPDRLVEVGPATIDVSGGRFEIGGRPALTEIEGHVEATIGALDLRASREVAVRSISGRGRVDGVVPNVDFVRLYLPSGDGLRVEDGRGPLHMVFNLEHGRILPGTRLGMSTERLILGVKDFVATAAFDVEARVDASVGGPIASGDIRLRSATISRSGSSAASPRIEGASAHFIGLPHDLGASAAEIERTDLDIPVSLPDLGWLLPTKRPLNLAGAATLRARVTLDRSMTAAGRLEARSERTELTTRAFGSSARLAADVEFHDADFATKSVVLGPSSVVAGDLSIERQGRNHKGNRVRVDVSEGRIEDGVPRYFALTVGARLDDFGWLAFRDGTNWKRNAEARTGDVHASFLVRRPAALFDKGSGNPGITGSIDAALSADGRIDDVSMRGRLKVSALVDGFDPSSGTVRFGAMRADARDVEIDRGGSRAKGWWCRFATPGLDASTGRRTGIAAHVDARCKDGAPFLAALSSVGTIPSWAGDIFPMNGLTASGDVKSRDVVDLALDVKSTSANVTARLHDVGGKMDGAVEVSTALLSVGVGLTSGQSHVHFFVGEDWLNKRIEAVKRADPRRLQD